MTPDHRRARFTTSSDSVSEAISCRGCHASDEFDEISIEARSVSAHDDMQSRACIAMCEGRLGLRGTNWRTDFITTSHNNKQTYLRFNVTRASPSIVNCNQ
ncbi:hypothetical protein RRG08_053200 [Elysia crispata]|uniref:Uncharacterized protein n=1 Tax=Elysia crispata TaxID=231223 RepID=A0AAE1B660_9GAST|nr:hypothetical protein RRG08_053200 [Elysia crispata]